MSAMKPLCIDLCCGSGGWAAGFVAQGYDVIGFDVVRYPEFPGRLILQDVRTLDGRRFSRAAVIVASPPCEEFSRHGMPWTKRRKPPAPDLSVVEACWRIAREAGVPIVLENVRAAQYWLGPARAHVGPFYLWGDVPCLLPSITPHRKEHLSSARRTDRARIPFELAAYIAQVYRAT